MERELLKPGSVCKQIGRKDVYVLKRYAGMHRDLREEYLFWVFYERGWEENISFFVEGEKRTTLVDRIEERVDVEWLTEKQVRKLRARNPVINEFIQRLKEGKSVERYFGG